jgi:nucleoid-associated protein YgaU
LLRTSLKGLQPGSYEYIGGVYTGGLDNCSGCAQIVVVVVRDPNLPGTFSDEQYQAYAQDAEKRFGARLEANRKIEVSGMPGAESVHIGASRRSKLWECIMVPPEPGLAYLFSCSSHINSYDDFLPIFERAMQTLNLGTRQAPLGITPAPTRVVYVVKAGDTLSQIAKQYGVTLQALVEANDIRDPSLIRVGQELFIPRPSP